VPRCADSSVTPVKRALASIGLAAALLATAAAAAPTWLPPAQISPGPLAVDPHLALSPAGEAVVVWDHEVGSVCATAPDNPACIHILEASSRPAGSWEAPVELMRPGVGSGPRVAVNNRGDAVAVWRHDIGAPRVLQAAYRPGTSRQWQAPIDLSEAGAIAGQEVGLDGAGNAVAVWNLDRGGGYVVQAEERPAASGVWGAPINLSQVGGNAPGPPSLALNANGGAVAVWARAGGVVQASLRTSGVWQPATDLSAPGALLDPDVAIDPAGDAVAVWSWQGPSGTVVQAAFHPAGGGWTAPAQVSGTPASPAPRARTAIDGGGNAVVVWLGGPAPGVRAATRPRATGAWSRPAAVSTAGQAASTPEFSINPAGNALAVWRQGGTTVASLRPANSGVWFPPTNLSAANVETRGPQVAVDDAGRAVAIWSRFGPAENVVDVAPLTASGPAFSARIPAKDAARVPVLLSVLAAGWAAPLVGQPSWQFGDGTSATGATVRHAYSATGRYTVTVSQSDAAGGTSTATQTLRIVPVVMVTRPSLAGTPVVGSTLTCRRGSWRGAPPLAYAFRWLRNGTVIAGPTGQQYTLRAADDGKNVACRVTVTNALGGGRMASLPVRVRAA
jgi:PKD domain